MNYDENLRRLLGPLLLVALFAAAAPMSRPLAQVSLPDFSAAAARWKAAYVAAEPMIGMGN